jgi:hypothetical protein
MVVTCEWSASLTTDPKDTPVHQARTYRGLLLKVLNDSREDESFHIYRHGVYQETWTDGRLDTR